MATTFKEEDEKSTLVRDSMLVLSGVAVAAAASTALRWLMSSSSGDSLVAAAAVPVTSSGAPVEGGPQLVTIEVGDEPDLALRRLRKCEAVIQRRTDRLLLVVERATKSHNYSAVLRTAEALGVHDVWCVNPPSFDADAQRRSQRKAGNRFDQDAAELQEHLAFAKRAGKWLNLRAFHNAEDCIAAMVADGREIWVSDLSQQAVSLSSSALALPQRMALVIGTESTGASPEMLRAAHRRIYLPLHGFADSLNLSVAAAMLMQRLLFIDPTLVGGMCEERKAELRADWYPRMGRNEAQAAEFAAIAKAGGVPPLDDVRRCDAHRSGWVMKKVRMKNEAKGFYSGIGFDGREAGKSAGAGGAKPMKKAKALGKDKPKAKRKAKGRAKAQAKAEANAKATADAQAAARGSAAPASASASSSASKPTLAATAAAAEPHSSAEGPPAVTRLSPLASHAFTEMPTTPTRGKKTKKQSKAVEFGAPGTPPRSPGAAALAAGHAESPHDHNARKLVHAQMKAEVQDHAKGWANPRLSAALLDDIQASRRRGTLFADLKSVI